LTHVVWDSFTHGDGYLVRQFPGFFGAQVAAGWDVNRILQYVSRVGGCLVLAIWLRSAGTSSSGTWGACAAVRPCRDATDGTV
jgi:hypothetical protein